MLNSQIKDNFKNVIKYYKGLSEAQRMKALDSLLLNKIIGKMEYRVILKECQNKNM